MILIDYKDVCHVKQFRQIQANCGCPKDYIYTFQKHDIVETQYKFNLTRNSKLFHTYH